MCIIIDANSAHHLRATDPAGSLVLAWLLKGRGRLVVCAETLKELARTHLSPTLLTLDRAGRLIKGDEEQYRAVKAQIESSGLLQSDDPHIVALASLQRCDLVYTHDQPLHRDLKNRELLPFTCSIYQTSSHRHLLGECNC